MFVEYGERSGVNQVPFHVKETYLMNYTLFRGEYLFFISCVSM